jgi:hypothetical protein
MGRILALLFLTAATLGLSGCASSEDDDSSTRVSTIPWNRPEQWEGQGPLGSMMNPESGGF